MSRLRNLIFIPLLLAWSVQLHACPFCSAVSQTFSEEMDTMDVVTLVSLERPGDLARLDTENKQAEVPKSEFKVKEVLKGDDYIKAGDTFKTIHFGEQKKDRTFLAMATDAPNLMWSTPLILSDRATKYLEQLGDINAYRLDELKALEAKLPKRKPGSDTTDLSENPIANVGIDGELTRLKGDISTYRLSFFQDYLEDEDEMLARDAYDEFAKAPYQDVINLKPKMNHDKLIEFIENPDVPSNRRRLYFTMLGVCGSQADATLLEELMQSDDRKKRAGLDAMLACYMILTGDAGLDKVDELFLKNKDAEYADTYAAIMAIRFHGAETDVIPRSRLVKSLRHMLDRPELADLVIPDLARWEDWEVMPKLVDLFVSADENSSWVRVPVVNYLRACPLPVAKEKIEELKKVDSEAVKRAMQFFPLKPEKKKADPAAAVKNLNQPKPQADPVIAQIERAAEFAAKTDSSLPPLSPAVSPQALPGKEVAAATTTQPEPISPMNPRVNQTDAKTSIVAGATINQAESQAGGGANFWTLLAVSLFGGGLCFVAMRSILGHRV